MHGTLVYLGEASTGSLRIQMPVGYYWSSVGIQKLHFHPMAELTVFTVFERLQFRFMIIKSLKEFRTTSARITVFTGKGEVKSQKKATEENDVLLLSTRPWTEGLGGHKPILSPNPIYSVKRALRKRRASESAEKGSLHPPRRSSKAVLRLVACPPTSDS